MIMFHDVASWIICFIFSSSWCVTGRNHSVVHKLFSSQKLSNGMESAVISFCSEAFVIIFALPHFGRTVLQPSRFYGVALHSALDCLRSACVP